MSGSTSTKDGCPKPLAVVARTISARPLTILTSTIARNAKSAVIVSSQNKTKRFSARSALPRWEATKHGQLYRRGDAKRGT